MCAAFRPTWPAAAIYGVLLVGGFLRSLQFTAYNTLAYGDVSRARMSAATSLYTAGQQLAATVGVSAGAVSLEVARVYTGHASALPSDFSVAFLVVARDDHGRRADRAVHAAHRRRRPDRPRHPRSHGPASRRWRVIRRGKRPSRC